ncbi:MAG: hypothetical protein IJV07_02460, partial [Alphaproteobacteria bacterium]|nr:hypothetical protein [Alphaproteobacteria bacterium]
DEFCARVDAMKRTPYLPGADENAEANIVLCYAQGEEGCILPDRTDKPCDIPDGGTIAHGASYLDCGVCDNGELRVDSDAQTDVCHYCDSNTLTFVLKDEQKQTVCGTDPAVCCQSCSASNPNVCRKTCLDTPNACQVCDDTTGEIKANMLSEGQEVQDVCHKCAGGTITLKDAGKTEVTVDGCCSTGKVYMVDGIKRCCSGTVYDNNTKCCPSGNFDCAGVCDGTAIDKTVTNCDGTTRTCCSADASCKNEEHCGCIGSGNACQICDYSTGQWVVNPDMENKEIGSCSRCVGGELINIPACCPEGSTKLYKNTTITDANFVGCCPDDKLVRGNENTAGLYKGSYYNSSKVQYNCCSDDQVVLGDGTSTISSCCAKTRVYGSNQCCARELSVASDGTKACCGSNQINIGSGTCCAANQVYMENGVQKCCSGTDYILHGNSCDYCPTYSETYSYRISDRLRVSHEFPTITVPGNGACNYRASLNITCVDDYLDIYVNGSKYQTQAMCGNDASYCPAASVIRRCPSVSVNVGDSIKLKLRGIVSPHTGYTIFKGSLTLTPQ